MDDNLCYFLWDEAIAELRNASSKMCCRTTLNVKPDIEKLQDTNFFINLEKIQSKFSKI